MVPFPKVSPQTHSQHSSTHIHTDRHTHTHRGRERELGKWASLIEKNQAERNLIAAVWPEGGGKKTGGEQQKSERDGVRRGDTGGERGQRDKMQEENTNSVTDSCQEVMATLLTSQTIFDSVRCWRQPAEISNTLHLKTWDLNFLIFQKGKTHTQLTNYYHIMICWSRELKPRKMFTKDVDVFVVVFNFSILKLNFIIKAQSNISYIQSNTFVYSGGDRNIRGQQLKTWMK